MGLILTIIEYLWRELYDILWRRNVMAYSRTFFFVSIKIPFISRTQGGSPKATSRLQRENVETVIYFGQACI